jgi:hypothetical protein
MSTIEEVTRLGADAVDLTQKAELAVRRYRLARATLPAADDVGLDSISTIETALTSSSLAELLADQPGLLGPQLLLVSPVAVAFKWPAILALTT